ncbi:uncharacterized protein LOC122310294 [Carya illinoinensis]|uniref:uncharacterized protein LOC122310294 n=1 Tax=Carya illinoinensis TaxID=32201 RepID=UPI001C728927|nr:uncharacterized protein LOC122310294 [Carya illinoinensis]
MIHGFPICRGKLSINHLFFADDSLRFCRPNAREWSSIHILLKLYEEASGQKLNKTKTSIFFNPNTRSATKDYILSLAGTRSSSCYEKYLGLPALVGRSKNAAFKGIIDRIRAKVGNWKNKFLSHAESCIIFGGASFKMKKGALGVLETDGKIESCRREDDKVERLINNETKQWDKGLITDALGFDTAAMILKIAISSSGAKDKLIWLGTKDGSFTVKIVARSIWLRRNKLLFEGSFLHPNQVLKQASQSLEDFKDAVVDMPQNRIGIGLVARDHEGTVLVTKKLSISTITEPILVEALGAFHAATLAKELGLNSIILEGDALQIVNGINLQAKRWDRVGMILLDNKVLLSSLNQWKVVFVRRSGNQVAHELAKESLELAENSIELVYRPLCNPVPPFP